MNNYVKNVYSLFLGRTGLNDNVAPRPYTFDIPGDQNREVKEWRCLLAQEHVAVIGLGGIGAWIADLVVKADAKEVHGWDHDRIEPKNILRMPGAVDPKWIDQPKARWFQDTYSQIHTNVHGHVLKAGSDNADEFLAEVSFAFVAVDQADDRMVICDLLASAKIPFVVVGLSLVRQDKRVRISMRIVTAYPHVDSWRNAIPQVGQAGQDDYGSLDLPDVYSMAASWAMQSWRKMRGQVWQEKQEECVSYRVDKQRLSCRGV